MALKLYKPTSPGRRFASCLDFSELTKKEPERRLTIPLKKKGGRNNYGYITCRHRGGGVKRKYRIIDFKRDKIDIPGKVVSIEYDPNRNVFISLVSYADGEKRYILCPEGLKVGDTIISSENAEIKTGNTLPLEKIPEGILIHNIELIPGRGGQLARSAGCSAQITSKEDKYVLVRLPSGEIRRIHKKCKATIGQLGNIDYNRIWFGKAGRRRLMGWRPTVRGSAQNPVSHPMGGGEGRRAGGRHPVSFSGVPAKGGKTRNPRKISNKLIVVRRPRGRFQKT